VLVGGEPENSDTSLLMHRDLPLIETWQNAGLTVVAVEPYKALTSYLPTYRNAGIATIDAIDRAAGKIALPFALKGERAAYGYRPDAERVLSESLTALPSPSPAPTPTVVPSPSPSVTAEESP